MTKLKAMPTEHMRTTLEASIKRMWDELRACSGRRTVHVTRSGHCIRPADIDRHKYTKEVGSYDKTVKFEHLREDVLFILEGFWK